MRVLLAGAGVLFAWVLPGVAWAHGIGGRQDLPVPVSFFVAGAGAVLVATFVSLAVLWPKPRLQETRAEHPLGGAWLGGAGRVLGALGLLGLLLVVAAGLVGADNASRNPAPVLVFVLFWLVVPFVSALVGNLYPAVDPWRVPRRLLGVESRTAGGSVWPAVMAFMAFTWLELVSPDRGPRALAVAALVYTGYLVTMWALRRPHADVDGFAVYNRLLGAMAPFGTDDSGRVVRRGYLRGLPQLAERPGMTAFVIAMIGTVTYDGTSATPWWQQAARDPVVEALGGGVGAEVAVGTVGLVAITGAIGLGYLIASWAAARMGGAGSVREVAGRFAHTLVPIAFAYAFAHYFTLVLFEGQMVLSTVSDPFGLGWDLFGTADRKIDFSLIARSTVWVWYVQVAVIVLGHVAGVVLAHDRALADFRGVQAVRSQYAMLGLMIVLTGLGLVILSTG